MRTPTALSSAACVAAEADSRMTSTAAEADTCIEALPVPAQRNSMLVGTVVSTLQKPVCRRLENERNKKKRKKERKSTDPVPRTRRVVQSAERDLARVQSVYSMFDVLAGEVKLNLFHKHDHFMPCRGDCWTGSTCKK